MSPKTCGPATWPMTTLGRSPSATLSPASLSCAWPSRSPSLKRGLELEVEVQWGVVGSAARHTTQFSVVAASQRTDLDWDRLTLQQPYNLEVAYDKDFYGRKDALQRIVRRLATTPMQSSYITGQKRVGKSSLARAIEKHLIHDTTPATYRLLYLECGEIRHAEGADTLRALGERLEEFFVEHLPRSAHWESAGYFSSLAPLNKLLELLRAREPSLRFVVILDEFDEINESLYRYGELANTLFLNVRTLSSKKNLAFILVGAERMPYVMASQGDKIEQVRARVPRQFCADDGVAGLLQLGSCASTRRDHFPRAGRPRVVCAYGWSSVLYEDAMRKRLRTCGRD